MDMKFPSTNNLKGVNAEFLSKDRGRKLKKQRQGALKSWLSGDDDFDQPTLASA